MKPLIRVAFLFVTFGCQNQTTTPVINENQVDLVSRIRKTVLAADLLLHHQVYKQSLVVSQATTPTTIDSFFSYVGSVQRPDSLCFRLGAFNRYGEIRLFSDTLGGSRVGTLYFVVDGTCNGFYIAFNKKLTKYS